MNLQDLGFGQVGIKLLLYSRKSSNPQDPWEMVSWGRALTQAEEQELLGLVGMHLLPHAAPWRTSAIFWQMGPFPV